MDEEFDKKMGTGIETPNSKLQTPEKHQTAGTKNQMSRKKILIVLSGVIVAAVLVVVMWPGEKEPVYQGRKLSEWLLVGFNSTDSSQRDEASFAIRQIGTNGLPTLIAWVGYEESPRKKKVISALRRLPGPLRRFVMSVVQGHDRLILGGFGFRILGPRASPAVPELTKLLSRTNSLVCDAAMGALASIGKEGMKPLMQVLENRGYPNRYNAAFWLVQAAEQAGEMDAARPTIVQALKDENPMVVRATMVSLSQPPLEPSFAVPVISARMQDTNALVRYSAVNALARFGTNATSAVPALRGCLTDPDPVIRQTTTNALREIAPEVLEKLIGGH